MVENNGYIIPIENYKKTEEIREIDNEIPSYEEFMKNYKEEAVDSYENEFDNDVKVVVKPVASGALIAASIFPPTAAVAMPITIGVGATGAGLMGLGHVTDSNGLKGFGKDVVEIALNANDGHGAVDSARDNGTLPRLKK
ncbi:34998_t:CDS:2 [Gigaspora margarita]|uniref:34998_t:CDS:1 n=1 Tax=Gigaspora margarita TaxID=4874 RepID=A0ABN7WDX8_GIGMA|nr:34998_t:CDS:2 [Gigaspora margarita]